MPTVRNLACCSLYLTCLWFSIIACQKAFLADGYNYYLSLNENRGFETDFQWPPKGRLQLSGWPPQDSPNDTKLLNTEWAEQRIWIITTHELWVIWRHEVTAIPTSSMPSTTSALVREGSLLKLTEFYETKCLESRRLLCMWDEFHMRSTKLKELLKRKNKEHHLKVYHQLDHCGGEDSRPKQEHYSPP